MIDEAAQVGLDFGTTTTLLTYTNSDLELTEIVPLSFESTGRNWLPSLAAYVDGKIVVGPKAEAAPHWAQIPSAKRHITLGHESVTLIDENGTHVSIDLDEVIVAILSHVVDMALERGMDLRERTVRLGCPSAWNGPQRRKLIECAQLAGMNKVSIDDIRDEPVAAGLQFFDYLRRQGREYRGNLLVFDMGGGTLDVALLKINSRLTGAEVFVLASDGNSFAGDAFDEYFAALIAPQLLKNEETELPKEVFSYLSKQIVESAKKSVEYTGTVSSLVNDPYSERTSTGEVQLTEQQLVEALDPIMIQAKALIDRTLRQSILIHNNEATHGSVSKIKTKDLLEDVDTIFLVGGMTQLHSLRKSLQELFPGKSIISQLDLQ